MSTTRAHRALALVVALLSVAGLTRCSAPGGALAVRDGRLVDSRGTTILLRGINYPFGWYAWRTDTAEQFAAMKATGANSVRVVLNAGRYGGTPTTPAEVSAAVSLCQANRLLCILEVHDTTGYGSESGARTLAEAADYFVGIRDKIIGLESFVLVNIGNEPFARDDTAWGSQTIAAIRKLRTAGINHTVVVDAPGYGQDGSGVMRDQAASVWQVDQNLLFSVHMYEVYGPANSARISQYLSAFTSRKLPIIVGEFGPANNGNPVDVETILSYTRANGIGWLGWSWSGNSNPGGCCSPLDMVRDFDLSPAGRLPWGTRLVEGADGLRATGREAAVFTP